MVWQKVLGNFTPLQFPPALSPPGTSPNEQFPPWHFSPGYFPPWAIPSRIIPPWLFSPTGCVVTALFWFVASFARVRIEDSSGNRFASTAYFAKPGLVCPWWEVTGGKCQGGNCPWGELPLGGSNRWGIVREGNARVETAGRNCPGVKCPVTIQNRPYLKIGYFLTKVIQKWSDFYERCGMYWNERKIIYKIFPIFIFYSF